MKRKKSTLSFIMVILCIAFSTLPLLIMVIGGFKHDYALFKIPPDLNPLKDMTLKCYEIAFTRINLLLGMRNSLIASGGGVVILLCICSTAGYVFAKKSFPLKSILFSIVIATMIMPAQILMVPKYLVADALGLTNKLIGLILTSIGPSFGIFLCKQFAQTIPDELLEAAQMDGSGELNTFLRIVLPILVPALAALSIFSFMGLWNDYLWAFIFLGSKSKQTLPVVISNLTTMQSAQAGPRFAAGTVAFMPMLVIFIFCQKYFISGITVGAVKG